jgi:hypothetical protein
MLPNFTFFSIATNGTSLLPSYLVCKSEIQSLVPLVIRSGEIIISLFCTHCIPYPLPFLVDIHVEKFGSYKEKDVVNADTNENSVASSVHWLVVVSVNLACH